MAVLTAPAPAPAPHRHRPVRSHPIAKFGRRPALDGLRAVAATLVVFFHSGMPGLGGGYVGVDVFFVLSGFLITSLLVREIVGTGRLNPIGFYARRVRRLLPAAVFVLVVTAVVFDRIATPLQVAFDRGGFMAAAGYVSNWYFLAQSQDYFAQGQAPSPVMHYWSLSVEEQFYVAWPLLLLALTLLVRYGTRRLLLLISGLTLAGVVYAAIAAAQEPMLAYFGTFARAYQLLLGAALAVWLLHHERVRPMFPTSLETRTAGWLAAFGLALIVVAAIDVGVAASPFVRGLMACLGTAAVVVGLELRPFSRVASGLCLPGPQRVGKYSYAIYLWHWPVIVVAGLLGVLPVQWPIRVAAVSVVTFLLAAATWALVEHPAQTLHLPDLRAQRRVALAGPLLAVVVAALMVVVLPVGGATRDLIAQAGLDSNNESSVAVQTSDWTDARGTNVLLIGDSHAHYWFDGLTAAAEASGWRLTVLHINQCPWPRVASLFEGQLQSCDGELRDRAVQLAAQLHPDLILLASRSVTQRGIQTADGPAYPGQGPWTDAVRVGSDEFLDELAPYSDKIVIIEPVPETSRSMVDCLSTGVDPAACDEPSIVRHGTLAVDTVWEEIAKEREQVSTISLSDVLCPDDSCPSMVDGVVTYADTNHLTSTYAERLVPVLLERLAEVGAPVTGRHSRT